MAALAFTIHFMHTQKVEKPSKLFGLCLPPAYARIFSEIKFSGIAYRRVRLSSPIVWRLTTHGNEFHLFIRRPNNKEKECAV